MLTFDIEAWPDVVEEMKPLFAEHWREIGVDHEAIPMDMDWDMYAHHHEKGSLCVLVVRQDGVLIGYYIAIVANHLHYASTLFSFSDIYYVVPEYRGVAGVRLFIEAEKVMRGLGVKKITAATKVEHDGSPLFEELGWKRQEITYTKVLN